VCCVLCAVCLCFLMLSILSILPCQRVYMYPCIHLFLLKSGNSADLPVQFSRAIKVPALYVAGSSVSVENVHDERIATLEQDMERLDFEMQQLKNNSIAVSQTSSADGEATSASTATGTDNANFDFTTFNATLESIQHELDTIKSKCSGSNTDACDRGFYGENCTACSTCSSRGICHDGRAGSGRCLCFPGYAGSECDGCAPLYFGPACSACPVCGINSVCRDGLDGNGTCECINNHTGPSCSDCLAGYFGASCSACPDCGTRGVCADGKSGNGSCECDEGFGGSDCTDYTLVCEPGYFGSSCLPCTCGEHGSCWDGATGNGTCQCESGWEGKSCDCLSGSHMVSCIALSSAWEGMQSLNPTAVKLLDPDGSEYDYLGYGGVSLSADGLTLTATSYGDDDRCPLCGAVLVWQRSSTSSSFVDVLPVKLVDPNGRSWDAMGVGGVALSADGLILAVPSPDADDMGASSGTVLVWQRSSTSAPFSDVTPTKLMDPGGVGGDEAGYAGPSLSANGLILVVTSKYDRSSYYYKGAVLVWERMSLSTSFFEADFVKLTDPNGVEGDSLGHGGTSISGSGLVLAATSWRYDNQRGAVLVWQRSKIGISFSRVAPVKLVDPTGVIQDNLGFRGCSVSLDGMTLVVTSSDSQSEVQGGSVILWQRSNSDSSFADVTPVKLSHPDDTAEDDLGLGVPYISADSTALAVISSQGNGSLIVWTRASSEGSFAEAAPFRVSDPNTTEEEMFGKDGAVFSANNMVIATSSRNYNGMGSKSGAVLVWDIANDCEEGWSGVMCDE